MKRKVLIPLTTLMLAGFSASAPQTATAQEAGLYHYQGGVQVNYAEMESKVLFTALSARQFDLDFAVRVVGVLKTTITGARQSSDRAGEFVDEKQSRVRAQFEKLRSVLRRAEGLVTKVEESLENEVRPWMEAAEADEDDKGKPPPEPNWQAIKDNSAWLYMDVAAAKRLHGKLARKVKRVRIKQPRKPRTARE